MVVGERLKNIQIFLGVFFSVHFPCVFVFIYELILFVQMYLYVSMNMFRRKQHTSLEKPELFLLLHIDRKHMSKSICLHLSCTEPGGKKWKKLKQ